MLTENQIRQIQQAKVQSDLTYAHTFNKVLTLAYFLKSEEARKFWTEGVARRMRLISRAVENVFTLYPPDRKDLLSSAERDNVTVNLQSVFMNLYGVFDNLAFVSVYECGVEKQLPRNDIGLYSKKYRKLNILHLEVQNYLDSDKIRDWHNKHLKDFRDALAHRLPLYVPPFTEIIDTGNKLPCALFAQTINEDKMLMHPQVLANLNTMESLVNLFCDHQLSDQTLLATEIGLLPLSEDIARTPVLA